MFFDTYKDEFDMMNESYVNYNGEVPSAEVYDGVLESYMNDYIIFEATLRRDFLEVNGVLTEGKAGDFFKNIWEKIKAFCGKIKQTIKNIIERFKMAIGAFKETAFKQKLAAYMPYYKDPKADEVLKDCTVKGYKFKTVNDILNNAFNVGINIFEKYLVPIAKDPLWLKSDVKNIKDDDVKKMSDKIEAINLEDIRKQLHDAVYSEKDIEKPFKEQPYLKDSLIKLVDASSLITFNGLDKKFQIILKKFNDNIDKLSKNADKAASEVVNIAADIYKYRSGEDASKEDLDEVKTAAQYLLKLLPAVQSKLNSIISMVYNELVKETKEYFRVYLVGGKYLKSHLKKASKKTEEKKEDKKEENKEEKVGESYITTDLDYINAVVEAEMYELGL